MSRQRTLGNAAKEPGEAEEETVVREEVRSDDHLFCDFVARLTRAMLAIPKQLPKNGWNETYKFRFPTTDDILLEVRQALASEGIAVFPKVADMQRDVYQTSGGGRANHVTLTLEFTVVTTAGYRERFMWMAEGRDGGDFAVPKALTFGIKTFLSKLLMISSDVDPDAMATEEEVAPPPAPRAPQLPPRDKVVTRIKQLMSEEYELATALRKWDEDTIYMIELWPEWEATMNDEELLAFGRVANNRLRDLRGLLSQKERDWALAEGADLEEEGEADDEAD